MLFIRARMENIRGAFSSANGSPLLGLAMPPYRETRRTLVNEIVLVDTGAWIALFDSREEQHTTVSELSDLIESLDLLFPWPVLYETLRTRFVRRPEWIIRLNDRLKKPNVLFIDDS